MNVRKWDEAKKNLGLKASLKYKSDKQQTGFENKPKYHDDHSEIDQRNGKENQVSLMGSLKRHSNPVIRLPKIMGAKLKEWILQSWNEGNLRKNAFGVPSPRVG